MRKINLLSTVVVLIIVMGLLIGCESDSQGSIPTEKEEASTEVTVQNSLEDKALEIGEKYGLIPAGEKGLISKEYSDDLYYDEEIETRSEGVLFSDIYDYDGDDTPELLILRRQEGSVNCKYSEETEVELERSEYLFEMYECDEFDQCKLSDQFLV